MYAEEIQLLISTIRKGFINIHPFSFHVKNRQH